MADMVTTIFADHESRHIKKTLNRRENVEIMVPINDKENKLYFLVRSEALYYDHYPQEEPDQVISPIVQNGEVKWPY